jgi:hypothetical protein
MSQLTIVRCFKSTFARVAFGSLILPSAVFASGSGHTLTCSMMEGFHQAQFSGTILIFEYATAEKPEVRSNAEYNVLTSRKVVEGPDDAPIVREISESLESHIASSNSRYLAPGEFFSHEALSIEIVSENQDGVKTFIRSMPQAPGLNSTLLHDGLAFRARCE